MVNLMNPQTPGGGVKGAAKSVGRDVAGVAYTVGVLAVGLAVGGAIWGFIRRRVPAIDTAAQATGAVFSSFGRRMS